jgi:hypothetical protein
VGMGYLVSELGTLAADVANLSHDKLHPQFSFSLRPNRQQVIAGNAGSHSVRWPASDRKHAHPAGEILVYNALAPAVAGFGTGRAGWSPGAGGLECEVLSQYPNVCRADCLSTVYQRPDALSREPCTLVAVKAVDQRSIEK